MSAASRLDRYLPAVFQERERDEDPLRAVLSAFEHELDSIGDELTQFPNELDPATAAHLPGRDFLSWLAGWVAVDPTLVAPYPNGKHAAREARREQLLRALVASAGDLHAAAGTAKGLAEWLLATTEARVEVREWRWPKGFVIGSASTVGIDGWIDEQELPTHRCTVVIDLEEEAAAPGVQTRLSGNSRGETLLTPMTAHCAESPDPQMERWLRSVRRALDFVLPAGVEAWLLVRPVAAAAAPTRRGWAMVIGITSEIGATVIEAEV